jgi:MFS family permease
MHNNLTEKKSPFEILNIRLYIAFSLFFNSRFYYPIFTVMYLDYGLTIAQFAILNSVWAATIVAAEVPSGALADVFGRRKLLVFAGIVMIVELSLIAFAPRGNLNLLFIIFLINRILSGLAEAAASGADEALAYDSLKKEGIEDQWGRVLEVRTRYQSIAFIITMITGAAIYDPALVQKFLNLIGYDVVVTQDMTLRIPLLLTLFMGVMTLYSALRMEDSVHVNADETHEHVTMKSALSMTLNAGMWILRTPFALVIIASGLVFDGIIRMVITLGSQYYRMIDLPEASYGFIGAFIALLGFFIPRIALGMTRSRSSFFNLTVMSVLTIIALTGMSLFIPYWGLFFAFILFSGMYLNSFFISHYLNRITDSRHRATVLSFKGLFYNLSYGLIGIGYSLLITFSRINAGSSYPEIDMHLLENRIFVDTFVWFPKGFILVLVILVLFSFIILKRSSTLDMALKKDFHGD